MKPKPLAPLNHFTVPFSLTNCSFHLCADGFPHTRAQRDQIVLAPEPLETKMPQRLRRARSARLPDCPASLCCCNLQLRYQDPNLSRLLSCENDSSSYSGTYKVGKKKSSAFRFPPCVAYCADGSSR